MKNIDESLLMHILKWAIVISIPVWLVLTGIRLVASEGFLRFEYGRSNFPADYYGFTQEDRLAYAPYALQYLSGNQDIAFLSDLKFPDGRAMYNERELRHMVDVGKVSVIVFSFQVVLTIFLVVSVVLLFCFMTTRHILQQSLLRGAEITLMIIVALLVTAITNWDVFFELFHRLFFADGTWRFEYSDTLIRLFPEQFWFDAALAIGIFTTTGAIGLLILVILWKYKMKTAASQNSNTAAASEVD